MRSHFAREGADVLITYLEAEKDDAAETAQWLREEQNYVQLVERAVPHAWSCALRCRRA